MKTKWILQTNIFKEEAIERMIECFNRLKTPYDLVKIIPFSNELPEGITKYKGPVLAYGTTTLLKNIIKHKRQFFPGMWFNEEKFKPSIWGKEFGDDWLNKETKTIKLNEVLDNFNEQSLFIRPNSDFKLFSGDVFDKYDFEKLYKRVSEDSYKNLKSDTEVCLSPVKTILAEWRFVIIDKEVITGSRYKLLNQLNISGKCNDIPKGAFDLACKIANNKWQVHDVYVIDICEILGGFKVIEINCLNTSGFYDCDVLAIIHYASRLAEKQWTKKRLYE